MNTEQVPKQKQEQKRQAVSEQSRASHGPAGRVITDPALICWRDRVTLAALAVLGLTPWAQGAIQPLPDLPAVCPPLTAFATPTLFNVWFGTAPWRFPYG